MAKTLDTIATLMGKEVSWVTDPARLRPSKSEVRRLLGDSSKLRELTGWAPKYSLEDGLRKTIEWFTEPANLARYKADIYNR